MRPQILLQRKAQHNYAQNDRSTTYSEVKTISKAKQQNLFKQNHHHSNRNDPYHLLTRHEQVSIFRLRTGHSRLRNHLFHTLKIDDTDQCRCRTGSQTTEHFLLFCPNQESLRKQIWPWVHPGIAHTTSLRCAIRCKCRNME